MIGGVTYIGLLILGVPIAFVFALFAGLAGFLPHLRPIIGAVRMVLVAGGDSLNLAMWVIGIYAVVEFTESYMLTPLSQARAVFLPPAVVILNVGALFGAGPLQPAHRRCHRATSQPVRGGRGRGALSQHAALCLLTLVMPGKSAAGP